ncbi:hypothetical protein RO3G_05180 [Rhizopus delemar RA 99-880]|uniref:Uncharacterized protein n=1 Tax=Rhizopus delemar (strain RA 99-880 / ATCC MYA-4621 / FGSC 9543 / NRRL 43880) TaxID=246409 RepID=I1BW95_RHIO9|nr:hypothetical protein RO3G_05180 [Rhizopus delemar RA 99-880]|eukprot:EIE80475.1 hypothetical protein RO3G_05180 [Rhizopus delemar RA 99-880]
MRYRLLSLRSIEKIILSSLSFSSSEGNLYHKPDEFSKEFSSATSIGRSSYLEKISKKTSGQEPTRSLILVKKERSSGQRFYERYVRFHRFTFIKAKKYVNEYIAFMTSRTCSHFKE